MSLPILIVLENLGVPQVASEVILLNEPFDWTKTNALIEEIELKLASEVDLGKRKKIVKVSLCTDYLGDMYYEIPINVFLLNIKLCNNSNV